MTRTTRQNGLFGKEYHGFSAFFFEPRRPSAWRVPYPYSSAVRARRVRLASFAGRLVPRWLERSDAALCALPGALGIFADHDDSGVRHLRARRVAVAAHGWPPVGPRGAPPGADCRDPAASVHDADLRER